MRRLPLTAHAATLPFAAQAPLVDAARTVGTLHEATADDASDVPMPRIGTLANALAHVTHHAPSTLTDDAETSSSAAQAPLVDAACTVVALTEATADDAPDAPLLHTDALANVPSSQ